jgi:hypothetical protein
MNGKSGSQGAGNAESNGPTAPYGKSVRDQGWDIRPDRFWDYLEGRKPW